MIPLRNFKRFFYKTFKQPVYAFKVLARRSRAYLCYFFAKGKSSLPEAVTLFLTHRCNLRCKMCGQWGEGGVAKKQAPEVLKTELSLQDLEKLVDELSGFKPSITLFGGEPLLFEGCVDLIAYIKSKAMHCLMITNGSLLQDHAEALVKAGLDELNLSLDGGQELHDQIRGMPGLFERINKGLEKLNSCKALSGKNRPLVNLQCTITKYNYQHLEQLTKVAQDIKADSLTFHNLIFLNPESLQKQASFDRRLGSSSADWQGFVFEPGIDPKVLDEKRKEILSRRYDFSLDFYPNFSCRELEAYYADPCYSPSAQNCRCISPWLVAYVFPDGQIKPCLNFSYSFGNIKETGFRDSWNSVQATGFRRMLKANKVFPACVRCTELYRY
jgi:radical SAM protein with 4Fe4S-binding SPASM domain